MVKGSGIGETKKLLRSCLVSDPEEPAAADGWADSISKLEQWNTVVHPNNSVRVPQTHFLDPPEVRNAAGAMLGATGLGTGGHRAKGFLSKSEVNHGGREHTRNHLQAIDSTPGATGSVI